MELIQLILEDYKRERENKRLKKRLESTYPAKQNIRLTQNKAKEDAVMETAVKKPASLTGSEELSQNADQTVEDNGINTMQDYEKSGQLDIDMQVMEREQYMQDSYREAMTCCMHYQMQCTRDGDFIYIATDVGKWYFRPQEGHITLYHKNYELRRNQMECYHTQFTRECTIRELIWYIYKHDQKKKRRSMRNLPG